MDILESVLRNAAIHGTVAATVRAGGSWGLQLDALPGAAFHAVTSGSAHLILTGREPVALMSGDVVLLPSGLTHELVSLPGTPTVRFDHVAAEAALDERGEITIGTSPSTTQILCASYGQDPAATISPFYALPEVVHLPAMATSTGLRGTLALISDELGETAPGLRTVLDHAVNIVLIQLLRSWIENGSGSSATPSWLSGLGDPVIRRALTALHQDPSSPWTTSTLASRVGVSRATMARRFETEVGCSPGAYISTWRMELASRMLRTGEETVGAIARGVGYQSEYAFNRAFSRHHGISPGRYRSAHRS